MSSPEILSKYTPGKGKRERERWHRFKKREKVMAREPESEGIRKKRERR